MRWLTVKLATSRELVSYLWRERLWWIIPFVVTLLVIGFLLLFAHASPVAPFLYTVF